MQFDARLQSRGLPTAVFTVFVRKKSVKENAYIIFLKKLIYLYWDLIYISFSRILAPHIIITGTNNLDIVIMSLKVIVFFIIFLHNSF